MIVNDIKRKKLLKTSSKINKNQDGFYIDKT